MLVLSRWGGTFYPGAHFPRMAAVPWLQYESAFLGYAWMTTLLTIHKKRQQGHRVKVATLQVQNMLITALKSEFEWICVNCCISQAGRGRFFFSRSSWGKLPPLTRVLQLILCVSSFNQLCLWDGQLKKHLFLWQSMAASGILYATVGLYLGEEDEGWKTWS